MDEGRHDSRAGHSFDTNERLMRCIQELFRAFPSRACLRCGATAFSVRYDQRTFPVEAQDEFYEAIEAVCNRCGLTERHQMGPLRVALADNQLPVDGDG